MKASTWGVTELPCFKNIHIIPLIAKVTVTKATIHYSICISTHLST